MYQTVEDLISAVRTDTSERTDDYVTDGEILNWINDFLVLHVATNTDAIKVSRTVTAPYDGSGLNIDDIALGIDFAENGIEYSSVYVNFVYFIDDDGEIYSLTPTDMEIMTRYGVNNSDADTPKYYALDGQMAYISPLVTIPDGSSAKYILRYSGYVSRLTVDSDLTGLPPLYFTAAKKYAVSMLWRKHKEISLARDNDPEWQRAIERMIEIRDRHGEKDSPRSIRHHIEGSPKVNPDEVPYWMRKLM